MGFVVIHDCQAYPDASYEFGLPLPVAFRMYVGERIDAYKVVVFGFGGIESRCREHDCVKSPEDIEEVMGLSLLGVVPEMSKLK